MKREPDAPPNVREYLSILWRRKWILVLTTLAGVSVALAYSFRQPPTYASSATVLVHPVVLPIPGSQGLGTLNMASEQGIATSPAVSDLAERTLREDGSASSSVGVEANENEQTLVFTSGGIDPEIVRATAQAYASSYVEYRRDQILGQLSSAAEQIGELIDELDTQVEAAEVELQEARRLDDQGSVAVLEIRLESLSARIAEAQRQQTELVLASGVPVGEVLVPAFLPTSPTGPDHVKIGLLGLFLGLSLGTGFAFLRDRLDETVETREDIERYAGAPLLVRIPKARFVPGLALLLEDPFSHAAEAYRALRVRVLYAGSRNPMRTLMVSSFTHTEGKTTTAVNLAIALAQAEKRVAIVSADLHRPSLDNYFGAPRSWGLTDVLRGEIPLARALASTKVPNLTFLPSGPRVENPAELLGVPVMRSVLQELEELHDLVIIDSPPVLGTSDALGLAPLAQNVLLVADARTASRSSIHEAAVEFRSVGAFVLGIVLTNATDELSRYQYRQGSGYGSNGSGSPDRVSRSGALKHSEAE